MAKTLKDLTTEGLTRKRSRTTTPKDTPSPAPVIASRAVTALRPDIDPGNIDLDGYAPKDLQSVSSSLDPLSNTDFENDALQIEGQINRAKLMGYNARLITAIEDAKALLAKSAQSAVKKNVAVKGIEIELARFDTAVEKEKFERERQLQQTVEREGIEALRPLVRQRIDAERQRYAMRIAKIEESTQKALAGNVININALEI
jgi:hypothetical protein